ncbi:MAG: NAD-dependent epimerase/dehydratase family protein [Halioglobus sp.]|nr:NAD-dependent epimerase/dehydratase family protein [Halioglobus sp.]
MKVLVVGGTGLIGGDIALYLTSRGHEVTIMARKPSTAPSLAALPFMRGDYVNDTFGDEQLSGFDGLVFAAAADIRNMPVDGSIEPAAFYSEVNDVAVPRFIAAARDSGISRTVYIGTFYPQIAPERIGICPYVTSRHNTDAAVRALSSAAFNVCSLNAPWVLGHIDGLDLPHIKALVAYAKGQLVDLPVFAPPGGTNHISAHSIAVATLAALERGESGKAYLLGDENISWKHYLELWFAAAGNPQELQVKKDEHPLLPSVIMFAGAGATIHYEAAASEQLGYPCQQIGDLIKQVVANY